MADITSPDQIAFCDRKIRPLADLLAQLYNLSTSVIAEWTAVGGVSFIPNTADPVRDGANPAEGTGDGRLPIVASDAATIITRASEFVADMEANSAAKLNTVLGVAVNTTR